MQTNPFWTWNNEIANNILANMEGKRSRKPLHKLPLQRMTYSIQIQTI